jgi:REP element-mobilizing transposase RayT
MERYLVPVADIIAYCLMPTHYHLLVRVKPGSGARPMPGISTAMMRLSVSYTKAVNKRFRRVGVLFQGPFRAKPVLDSDHLLHLCRYIHGNPVKDRLVNDPSSWPYSNYLEWIGERQGDLVDRGFVHAQFPDPKGYKDFVLEYLSNRPPT